MSPATSSYQDWSRLSRKQVNRLITALTLLLTPCFCAVGMLNANASIFYYRDVDSKGLKLLSKSQTNMAKTSQWWDKTWNTMLTGENNSLSSDALFTFLLPFLLVLLLLFLARAGYDYFKGDFIKGFNRSVIPIVILSLFLAGNGLAAKAVAHGNRGLMTRGTDLLLEAQITEVNFREAIGDQLFSLELRNDFGRSSKYCRSLPAPTLKAPGENKIDPATQDLALNTPGGSLTALEARAYDSLGCFQNLLADIKARRADMKQKCPTCTTADQVAANAERKVQGHLSTGFLFAIGSTTQATVGVAPEVVSDRIDEVIKVDGPLMVQYWFVSGQEFMLYLAAYLAPIMILYGSLPLPGRVGIAVTYFSSFIIIALIRIVYVLIVGLGASFLSANPPNDGAEYWAQFLGYFAPAVSTAAVTGGVIAAVHAWSGQIIATIAVGTSLAAAGLGSAVSSFQQRDYRNR